MSCSLGTTIQRRSLGSRLQPLYLGSADLPLSGRQQLVSSQQLCRPSTDHHAMADWPRIWYLPCDVLHPFFPFPSLSFEVVETQGDPQMSMRYDPQCDDPYRKCHRPVPPRPQPPSSLRGKELFFPDILDGGIIIFNYFF